MVAETVYPPLPPNSLKHPFYAMSLNACTEIVLCVDGAVVALSFYGRLLAVRQIFTRSSKSTCSDSLLISSCARFLLDSSSQLLLGTRCSALRMAKQVVSCLSSSYVFRGLEL